MRLVLIPRQRHQISRQLHFGWYEVCRQGELAERKPGASKLPDYDVENGGCVGWWGRGRIFFFPSKCTVGGVMLLLFLSPGRPTLAGRRWRGKQNVQGERERLAKKRGIGKKKEGNNV